MKQVSNILAQKKIGSVLLITDRTVYGLGMTAELETELAERGIQCFVYKETAQNPTIENAEEAVAAFRENRCGAIIACGGGSAIDCAKAAGARAARPEKKLVQMAGVQKVRKPPPLLFAIPTTAGTGSETTLAAVITDGANRRKFAINDICLIPHYAVLAPALTVTLPKSVTAATGMDALTHAVEAYIGRGNTKQTKRDAERAFVLIKRSLQKAYENGGDIEARMDMLNAAHYAGRAFTRAYVGNVHAAAHTLSGFYGVPHGLANAVLLPVVLEYYGRAVYKKLARIAAVMEIGSGSDAAEERAKKLIAYIRELNAKINIPDKISDIRREDLPRMAEYAFREANPLYPVPVIFGRRDFENIFNNTNSLLL